MRVLDQQRATYNSWLQRGNIKPTVPSRGCGDRALFTLQDITAGVIVQRLRRLRVDLKEGGEIGRLAVLVGGIVYYDPEEEEVSFQPPEADVFLAVNVERIEAWVKQRIEEIENEKAKGKENRACNNS